MTVTKAESCHLRHIPMVASSALVSDSIGEDANLPASSAPQQPSTHLSADNQAARPALQNRYTFDPGSQLSLH